MIEMLPCLPQLGGRREEIRIEPRLPRGKSTISVRVFGAVLEKPEP